MYTVYKFIPQYFDLDFYKLIKPIIGQRSQYIDSILLSIIKSVIIFNSIYNPAEPFVVMLLLIMII